MLEENKLVPRRILEEGFSKGNLDIIDECFAKDFVDHNPGVPNQPAGPEGPKQIITTFRAAFPDLQATVEDQIAEGDKVATRWRLRGTHQGELFGMPPTGKQINFEGITILRIVDGKAVEHWLCADNLAMMQQLGAIPSPGQEVKHS